MSLHEALQKRGYSFRQHLEEASWTQRKLTVVDLDDSQRAALERGGVEGLRQALDKQSLWSFPALDIAEPLPVQRDVTLAEAVVVAPASSSSLARMARDFVDAVREQFGVKLDLLDDSEAELSLLQSRHVVLFGGSHENRFAMDMALRYQTCFVDATVPGDDGWIATTYVGLDAFNNNVAQIAASPSQSAEAMKYVLQNITTDGNKVILRCMHRIVPGPEMREHIPSWEKFAAGLPGSIRQLQGQPVEAPLDPKALADLLSIGLDSGGPDVNIYNTAPIDIAVTTARYYQLSGEPRALQLFHELLFRLADYYLKTPEGASYPSDLDFRIGNVILYYSRLEHEPIFSEEDRLILSNLLLSCTRSIYEYTIKCWPIDPNEPTRHNHETFAALSLMFAADYFKRHKVAYVNEWEARFKTVFSGGMWKRFKQRENANHYEQYTFLHGIIYSAFTGHRLDLFDRDCLKLSAIRQVITTDNFFRPVDYGDASISMSVGNNDMLATIVASQMDEPILRWYAHEAFRRQHHYLPQPLGVRLAHDGVPPAARVWEMLPLDTEFIKQYCSDFPEEYAFDKLAFRTGWTDDDHYVMIEGVGNLSVSHSHNEVNGIVRLNHLGRHWIVSNGYGRRAGMDNVAQSFNTRVRGPEDHNMLLLERNGRIVRDLPICNALLQRGQTGDLAFVTGLLPGYGGTDWFRTLLILADRFVLVIDRISLTQPGLEAAHIEWNCPGEITMREGGFRIDQRGVFMDVDSNSGWPTETGIANQSADWKRVLERGAYPYATFPLKKLIFQMPDVKIGQSYCLSTLLAATRSTEPAYRVSEPEPGLVRVEAMGEKLPDLRVEDQDLSVRVSGSLMEARFATKPNVPEALRIWSDAVVGGK